MMTDASALAPLHKFFTHKNIAITQWPALEFIDKNQLPKVAAFLLTQPLLTHSISQYYQRTPKILPPIIQEKKGSLYYRAIKMIMDSQAKRDNALLAHAQNESLTIELGFIQINCAALPTDIINELQQSDTPFGAILGQHQIKTQSVGTCYFKIENKKPLNCYLNADQNIIYGRCNTILRKDNQQWVAHVVELLESQP